MTPDEFDQMLHDAEVKLSRLRALYEQYFQGIEKLEPHVARKDLDRTFDLLRRGQPRNTALRFRLQQAVARYGTYMTYWQRIGRQIEEGTYKRDIAKVRKKRATGLEQRPEPSSWEIDVDIDEVEGGLALDETDVDAILGALGAKEKSLRPLSPLSVAPATPVAAAPQASSTAPKPAGAPAAAPRTLSPFAAFSRPGVARPAAATLGGSVAAPAPSAPGSATAAGPRPLTAFGARPAGAPPSIAAPMGAAQPGPAVKAPLPAMPGAAALTPSPGPTAAGTAARPATAGPEAPPARASALQPTPATPHARPSAAQPTPAAVARPLAPAPSPPAAVAPRPVQAGAPSDGLDERTMRSVYERYADARRKNNEGDVRFETLAQSVEKMMPKLREKHAGKKIDFEVVVANGRVGLKPKVGE